jgi:MFS transporter, DHA1 family, inner membrane transport protein
VVAHVEEARTRSRRVLVAYVIGAFGLAISAQINFLVPLRARELGAGFDVIGLIVGSGALSAAALSVTSGAIIDRLGPKWAFIVGATGTAAVSISFVSVTNYWWFLALQPLHGVFRNLGWVASQGYITSFSSDEERPKLTGRFSFFGNVGQMAGPLLVGGAAGLVGLQYALFVPAAYAGLFALLGLALRDTRAEDHGVTRARQGTGLGSAVRLLALRGIQVALLLTFVRLWTSHVYSTFFPVYLVDQGMSPGLAGSVMAASGLIAAIMAPTTGFWTRWVSQQTAASIGLGCSALGLLLAPHVVTVPLVFVVPVLVGIGSGLSLPLLISIVTTAAPLTSRGVALGLRGMVNQTAATAAPVLIGPLMSALGLLLGFTTGGLVAGGMLVAARWLHRTDPERWVRGDRAG